MPLNRIVLMMSHWIWRHCKTMFRRRGDITHKTLAPDPPMCYNGPRHASNNHEITYMITDNNKMSVQSTMNCYSFRLQFYQHIFSFKMSLNRRAAMHLEIRQINCNHGNKISVLLKFNQPGNFIWILSECSKRTLILLRSKGNGLWVDSS